MSTNDRPDSRIDVLRVAHLARLSLSDQEVQSFAPQLARVLEHIAQIASLELSSLDSNAENPMTVAPLRADEPLASLDRATVLRSAPEADLEVGAFVVPRFVDGV